MTESIEKKIDKLNTMIDKIEEDQTSIDDAISLYSDAMTLAKQSFEDLEKVKQKINIVKKEGASLVKESHTSD
ncbi:exodeoxyribonuclease VII small subunit [Candidatus Marinamargulisbacteria bacterium SCGC AAA071-K20]|nr:exodeoxyribonuclease VII small subunit [Candidatus Marinamargulisbacteria bacterium SCGC AAA071-K20]